MGFRENLLKKIHINRLAGNVLRSINPNDGSQRIDRDAMRELLEIGNYTLQKERDLDLYVINSNQILALDNELKVYTCTAEEIGLRKSPTVKEMVSIRNAIKILNDKDVVISKKADSVKRIQGDMINDLDLSYNAADIASMVNDGIESYQNHYTDGVIEILSLFAELLEFEKAPKMFRMSHHHIWGNKATTTSGGVQFGPVVIFGLMANKLKMIEKPINSADKDGVAQFQKMVKGEIDADHTDAAVFEALQAAVLKIHPTR